MVLTFVSQSCNCAPNITSLCTSDDDDDASCELPSTVAFAKQLTALSGIGTVGTETFLSSSSSSSTSSEGSLLLPSFPSFNDKDSGLEVEENQLECTNEKRKSSDSKNKLTFMLDEAYELAHMGCSSASLPTENVLPRNTRKSDIYVYVDIDDSARTGSSQATTNTEQRVLEDSIVSAIRNDLRGFYSAKSVETAKLVLCVVIVVLSDGTITRSYWHDDSMQGVAGLAEVGLVWQVFDADTLKVFGGGLVTQREDFGYGVLDIFLNRGKRYLVEKLAPRAADMVISRIGGANDELLVEI